MKHFPKDPVYKSIKGGDFRLVGETIYIDTVGYRHSIPDGFVFSPSIPRLFRPIVPEDSDTILASLPHDWLYQQQSTTRAFADAQWKSVLDSIDKSVFITQRSYYALRIGGWVSWRNNKKKSKRN